MYAANSSARLCNCNIVLVPINFGTHTIGLLFTNFETRLHTGQMLRIRKPRGISTVQLMVVTLIGFAGGIYIWKPLFLALSPQQQQTDITKSTTTSATSN